MRTNTHKTNDCHNPRKRIKSLYKEDLPRPKWKTKTLIKEMMSWMANKRENANYIEKKKSCIYLKEKICKN